MNTKNEFSVIDIIGISLIFIVLVVLIVPLVMKISRRYELDSTKIKATALLNTIKTEYSNDLSLGRTITAYCYRSDYGYPKTLNDGTVRSITNVDDDISYFVTLDENGYITSFVYSDEKYAIDIRENIDENYLNSLTIDDMVTIEDALLTIKKCPYNSN